VVDEMENGNDITAYLAGSSPTKGDATIKKKSSQTSRKPTGSFQDKSPMRTTNSKMMQMSPKKTDPIVKKPVQQSNTSITPSISQQLKE
jgi:hypothetical protein